MKRLFIGLVALFLAFGTVAACTQPAEASTKAWNGHVYLFRDHQALGGVVWKSPLEGINADCNTVPFYRWKLDTYTSLRASSVQVESLVPHCNMVGVYSGSTYSWYFACVGQYWKGYDFGVGYNDHVSYVDLRYSPSCGLYY